MRNESDAFMIVGVEAVLPGGGGEAGEQCPHFSSTPNALFYTNKGPYFTLDKSPFFLRIGVRSTFF